MDEDFFDYSGYDLPSLDGYYAGVTPDMMYDPYQNYTAPEPDYYDPNDPSYFNEGMMGMPPSLSAASDFGYGFDPRMFSGGGNDSFLAKLASSIGGRFSKDPAASIATMLGALGSVRQMMNERGGSRGVGSSGTIGLRPDSQFTGANLIPVAKPVFGREGSAFIAPGALSSVKKG